MVLLLILFTMLSNKDVYKRQALSDEEVIYKEEHSKLYYLRYKVEDDAEGRYAVVATTRPETIMGDTACLLYTSRCV